VRDKQALVSAILATLLEDAAAMTRAAKSTHEAATHPESKPENDKDTRGLELAYLAGAQAERAREIETAVKEMRVLDVRDFSADGAKIMSGALFVLDDGDTETTYFLVPHGGGQKHGDVVIVTPLSPIGRAVLGREVGDTVTVTLRGKPRDLTISEVS
jgi:transcription elongation GreA/GreB family factor